MGDLFTPKTYNISEFIKWDDSGELNLSPKFQRNSVWNNQARSYLIDTILQGLPIPSIFIRQTIDPKISKIFKEIIDGQQRLKTIIDFYNDKFPVKGPFAQKDYRGKFYSELSDKLKTVFISYEISVLIIQSNNDGLIYDMFARLNTNNMILNAQEIRNAKYWGVFKSAVYEFGRNIRDKFIEWKVFNDREFSRMKDCELINSLIIYLIDGIKSETPKIVNEYYEKYDEVFDELDEISVHFNDIITFISSVYNQGYVFTYFNRPRYFYTLFVVLDSYKSKEGCFPSIDIFVEKISRLETGLELNDNSEASRIKELHYIRTTNAKERTERINAVYNMLFG